MRARKRGALLFFVILLPVRFRGLTVLVFGSTGLALQDGPVARAVNAGTGLLEGGV